MSSDSVWRLVVTCVCTVGDEMARVCCLSECYARPYCSVNPTVMCVADEMARVCCLSECYARPYCRDAVNSRCYQQSSDDADDVVCATGLFIVIIILFAQ